MKFPNKYPFLSKSKVTLDDYSLVPIRYEDRQDIMKWRNEQFYHLRQKELLTLESQETYFTEVVAHLFEQNNPNQILFSYLKGDKCIGYGGLVHINWKDKNAEISFIMDTKLEKDFFNLHWKNYLYMLEEISFNDLNLHKIYTYAFDLRPYLYTAVEAAGYRQEAILPEHFYQDNKFHNVVIHSKINTK